MNSSHPTDDKQRSPRLSKTALVFMLVVLVAMALLAVFANVQRLRREKIETLIVKPVIPR